MTQNNISTICRDCWFAEYQDEEQIGCKFNRLEKFQEKSVQLTKEKCQETQKIYYKIHGRICNYCRNANWIKPYKSKKTPEELIQEEARITCDVILPIKFAYPELDGLLYPKQILKDFLQQFNKVIVVLDSSIFGLRSRVYNQLAKLDVQYKLVTELEKLNSIKPLVDLGVKYCQSQYYILSSLDPKMHSVDLVEKLNKWINEDLEQILLVDSDNLCCQTRIHKALGGNNNNSIEDKIKDWLNLKDRTDMMKGSWI